jgi:GH15 family glucan-1,4-alpha-glucosidase
VKGVPSNLEKIRTMLISGRNWDYRYCWVRDSSFTIYILLRMGFVDEANAYMDFISERFRKSRLPDGALPIMFTIHGEYDIPELELT